MPLISSRRNPIVRHLKELCTPQGRKKASMVLLEGTHLYQEAIKKGRVLAKLIATEKWLKNNYNLSKFSISKSNIIKVSPEVLEVSLTTKNPDGVACLLPFSSLPKPKKEANFILALDRLQDPGNVGTVFRNALAAEIEMIWLALGADPLGQKTLRASSGAILELPFYRLGNSEDDAIKELASKLQDAARKDFQIIGSYSPSATLPCEAAPYWEIDWMKPTVLVLGNEGSGLHPRIQSCCTSNVTLPHSKTVESLNVASASVPLLLERYRTKMISFKN